MKAVVLKRFGGPDHFELAEIPHSPPQAEEILVRVHGCSFNPVDLFTREGGMGGDLPIVLGRDFSGIVEKTGGSASEFKPGDRVYGRLPWPNRNGSYAEYVTVPVHFLEHAPKNIPIEEAAAIPVTGLTALHCVSRANVQAGDAVLVTGASGGVGSMAVQILQKIGADPILATAGSNESAEYIHRHWGIPRERIVDYRNLSVGQMVEKISAKTGGKDLHAAFDFAGKEMKKLCFAAVGPGGYVVSAVEEPAGFDLNLWDEETSPMVLKSVTFHFEQMGAYARRSDALTNRIYRRGLRKLSEMFEAGELKLPRIENVGTLSAETVRAAHQKLATQHTRGKLIMICK